MEEENYQNQNQELRQLHFQRMARLKKQRGQQFQEQEQTKTIVRDIVTETNKSVNQIYLNAIMYDKRPLKERHNVITLPQLLHPSVEGIPTQPISKQVEAVMITNYGFEMQVFKPILKFGVPLYVFNRDGENKEGRIIRNYEGFSKMTVISPPKNNMGYGVFHPKLWFIKFKTFLRIVVCTGNNHLFDWAIWQNAYWFHDCPLKTLKQAENKEDKSGEQKIDYAKDFEETLTWVISEIQPKGFDIFKQMKICLSSYSFKEVRAILIPSLSGRFKGIHMDKLGIGKIRKVIKTSKITMKNVMLTANCTSLGNVDEKLVREVYNAFCPSAGLFSVNRVRLVYPTDRYIRQKSCGQAGVLFLTPQNYQKCKIKDQIFYRYEPSTFNGVQGAIPHLKTIVVQEQSRIILYMGSHNLTKAAWGTFQKNEMQINCNNEQLGLLFLEYPEEQLLQWLPYAYPPEKYEPGEKPFLREMS